MEFILRMEEDYDLNMKVLIVDASHGRSQLINLENLLTRCPRGFFRVIKYISMQQNQRSNTPALYLSRETPRGHCYQLQLSFCTTIVLLSELLVASPGFSILPNHYPFVQETREIRLNNANNRGNIFTYYELLTCLAADQVIFKSYSVMMKFIGKLGNYIQNDKDFWPDSFIEILRSKSKVVYCPLNGRRMTQVPKISWKKERKELLVIWPHCWEFDRNPMLFFKTIQRLDTNGYKFKICVLEERFCKKSSAFHALTEKYKTSKLFDFGYVTHSSDKMYYTMLKQADVVLTTCKNELFFGVTVAEAICSGCVPVFPKKWSYKKLYAKQVREMYEDDAEIYNILVDLCRQKMAGALHRDYRPLAAVHSAEGWFRNAMRNISNVPTE